VELHLSGAWPVLSPGGSQVGDGTEKVEVVAVVSRVDQDEDLGYDEDAGQVAGAGKLGDLRKRDWDALAFALEVIIATSRGGRTA
jgi:hypothetical protein